MILHRLILLAFSLSIIATIPWGVDQGCAQPQNGNANGNAVQNQLNSAQNAAAEVRKAKRPRQLSTTNDFRIAAAKRNADRKAAYAKKKGGDHGN